MQMESLGRMLPAILFPHVQQWAERAGLPLLSQLLVDEQFRSLLEKYGDEMMKLMAGSASGNVNGHTHGNGQMNGNGHGNGHADGHGHAHGNGHASEIVPVATQEPIVGETGPDRARSMQEAQQALLELLRIKIRPLALALGCCPECLVGIDGCPNCWGKSKVGYYPPDHRLLEAAVIGPLAARGVPLVLNEAKIQNPSQPERGADHGRGTDAREFPL
jgi:hypothetical protein